jgi:hypothetical protein
MSSSQTAVRDRLVALGVGGELAAQAASVAGSVGEALLLLGLGPDGRAAAVAAKDWKEGFCEKNQRYYYFTAAASQWDAPLVFRFQEWCLERCAGFGARRAARRTTPPTICARTAGTATSGPASRCTTRSTPLHTWAPA